MADYDVIASPTPGLPVVNKPAKHAGRPTVAELKALLTTNNAGYFTAARLQSMTYNDLIFEARARGVITK